MLRSVDAPEIVEFKNMNATEALPASWRDPLFGTMIAACGALAAAVLVGLQLTGAEPVMLAIAAAGAIGFTATSVGGLWVLHSRERLTRQRASLWRSVGNALPFPSFVADAGGRAVYANSHFHKEWPDSMHAPLAELRARLGGGEDVGSQIAWLAETATRGVTAAKEIAAHHRGKLEWLRLSVYPLGDGRQHVLWAIEDITARREMEQVIREEQAKLIDFLENAPVGFYSVDGDGRFLLMNRTMADWLGTDMGSVREQDLRLHDCLVEKPGDGTPAFSPFPGDGTATRGETLLAARDGHSLPVFISQTVVDGDDERGMRTRTVVRDLTPERQWEQALKRSEQRFERFFEDAPVGIVLLDAAGRVLESNQPWQALAAPGQSKIDGRALTDFVSEDDAGPVAAWLERITTAGVPATPLAVSLRALSDGGKEPVATIFASRMDDGEGGVYGLILHFLEMSQQKSSDGQLLHAQKMQAVGQLAGGIAHDFNNLLTAMIGFCDLLLLRHSPGDQSFGDIMQIKQNASRAANLVRQLLAFSRQQTLQPKVLNITDVLAELSNLLRRLIGANIKLDVVHGRDMGLVWVDQGQLEQVIINLAVNARDAMAENGVLTIRTETQSLAEPVRHDTEIVPAGDYVVVRVSDTGTGIPSENVEHIFEPFFTTKEVGAGTGLGLSTVYGIVKQTGGHIFVESTSGEGTTFVIDLPLRAEEEVETPTKAEIAAKETKPDLTGAGTILLVEDEDAVRLFSARALRAKGYKILEARTGEAALDVIDEEGVESIDLLITDVVMPEMDGPTLIKEVRERKPDLKVICISGYAEDSLRRKIGEGDDIHF
ncbi:MAG: ATP-binding protein, partial [Alphaproteobacteria bacterium]